MKYSAEALKKAVAVVDRRRCQAMEQFEQNRTAAYQKIPQLVEIDRALSASGIAVSKAVLNKGTDCRAAVETIRRQNQRLIEEKKRLLAENGLSEDFLNIPFTCRHCNDTGFVDAMPCECLCKLLSEETLQKASARFGTQECSFEQFDLSYYPEKLGDIPCRRIMQQIAEACQNYAEDFSETSPNLLLFGGTGIGKTHLSLAIAKKVAENGYNVTYLSAPDLFTALEKERFNGEKNGENFESLTGCDLLLIDDLGAEFTTSFTISALYNLINTRLLAGRPTIITANLVPSELQQRYSERIASRLLGCFEHLHFVGNDIRILKKKGNKQ